MLSTTEVNDREMPMVLRNFLLETPDADSEDVAPGAGWLKLLSPEVKSKEKRVKCRKQFAGTTKNA